MRDQYKRVLIIGSDQVLRDLLCDVIQSERGDVVVDSSKTVPERYLVEGQEPLDLLIVDGALSGQNGLDLISAVQARRPQASAILITAADREEIRERRQHTTASFTLFTKPFSIDSFLSHLDRVLGKATVFELPKSGRPALQPAWNWV